MMVDPRAEWAEIFRRNLAHSNANISTTPKCTARTGARCMRNIIRFVASVGHRADLDYLIAMVGGELTVGHSYLARHRRYARRRSGGTRADCSAPTTPIENGKYRISHIYTGENWNPDLRAPLSAPGIDVSEGDYLLEVNGRPLAAPANVYSLFEGTAGRQTMIRVNKTPSLEDQDWSP